MTAYERGTKGTLPGTRGHSDDGAVALIVAIVIVALIGVVALVVDVGALFQARRQIQTAADAAALAGVQELPANRTAARDKALAYVAMNAPDANATITFTSKYVADDTIRVSVLNPAEPLYFANIWGDSSSPVGAVANATITSPTGYGSGLLPIGLMANGNESAANGYGFTWNTLVTLKEGGGGGTTGNYGWVYLEATDGSVGNGASWIKKIIQDGGGQAHIGDVVQTKTGVAGSGVSDLKALYAGDTHTMADVFAGPDANGVYHVNRTSDYPCPRLILVPVVANHSPDKKAGRYEWPNGTAQMDVVGFAEFFITGTGGKKSSDVDGYFLRVVSAEQVQDYGGVWSSAQVHYALTQ